MYDLGPRFVPTFLYYFVSTTLIALFVLSKGIGDQLDFDPSQIAIALGLVAGGLGGYFNSTDTLEMPVKNKGGFTKRLQTTLEQMGFAETDTLEDITVYERPFPSGLFSGKIFVQIEKDTASVSGRSGLIRGLKKRLNP